MKNFILIFLILLTSCFDSCFSDSIVNHVEFHSGTTKKKCEYSTLNNKRIGSALYYDLNGKVIKKINYVNGEIIELLLFVNDEISYKENFIDSNLYIYYPKGKLKTYQKYNHEGVYYYNNYDSITGKIIKCYRDLNEDIWINEDSVKIKPFAKTPNDKLENYTYYVTVPKKISHKTDTFFLQKKNGVISFKNEKRMRWEKIICDSIGCYSLPVTLGIEK
ncbi:MAG: hypothetical protein PSX81_08965 [bacterium]|nr:hypothetical protein [bacterium]